MKKIEISNSLLRAEFQPQWGGLFSALKFNHPVDGWVDAFVTENQEPRDADRIPFFGCFTMVPFANRMAGGIVEAPNGSYEFPIQWPGEKLAIHGTGWDKPWAVGEQTPTSLSLVHDWASDRGAFHFRARLRAALDHAAITLDLALQNLSDQSLPLGLGFHPWFSHIHQATVSFGQALAVNRESPWSKYPMADMAELPETFVPADYDGLDSTFDGWLGRVNIDLQDKRLRVAMTSGGALDRIHVFVMGDNDRFCLEPVSHKPGDLHDPGFLVEPGQSVSGQMKLLCSGI